MKMAGFILMSVFLGLLIAAYIKLPKDSETLNTIRLFKFVIFTVAMTIVGLFTLAMFGSSTSFKLF